MNRLLVLDTNVLVSAGLSSGPPAQIVERLLWRELSMIVSPGILHEYLEVMHRPKFGRHGFPPTWLERLLVLALRVPIDPVWPLDLPDPKDAVFLALAKASGAALITGNLRHFPEKARAGVPVLSPSDFLLGLRP